MLQKASLALQVIVIKIYVRACNLQMQLFVNYNQDFWDISSLYTAIHTDSNCSNAYLKFFVDI